jgi:hypothetical protein
MVEWAKIQIPALVLGVAGLSGVGDLMGGMRAVHTEVAEAVLRLAAALAK